MFYRNETYSVASPWEMNCVLAPTFDQAPLSLSFSASCWKNLIFFFHASYVANIICHVCFFGWKILVRNKKYEKKKALCTETD